MLRKQQSLNLRACLVNEGIEEELLQRVLREAGVELPAELMEFYREMNGVELDWSIWPSGEEIPGAILLLPLQKTLFGYPERIERTRYSDAFEDSLWTRDSFSNESIDELKQHRVLEAIPGEPAFVTFKPSLHSGLHLFFVYEEDISSIQVPLGEYLRLIFEHLGAARIREHLTREDWKQVIESDSKLTTIRRMR
ncbi:SMI1/KNR4 family protein [Corallococcus sp. AB045]|nr:SMI1/KNR4 family protein [Corallococcus sp. AB045]